jgi:hypothetical protein
MNTITVDRYEEMCAACPTIYDIYLSNGVKLYFRLRNGSARICNDMTEELIWSASMPHHDGFITLSEIEVILFREVIDPLNKILADKHLCKIIKDDL